MLGAIALAVVIVIVLPMSVMMGSVVIAAVLGWTLKTEAEATHEGSELIDLNK